MNDSHGRQKNAAPDVHLNLNVRGLGLSATIAISQRCEELRREGKKVYRLGLGQSPFPVPDPVVDALRLHASKKDYLPSKGLGELREAIAEYHRRAEGVSISPDHVLVGPGSKELMFLLQLVYYGDLVIPTPAWVSYAPQARVVGRNVLFLPAESARGWKLDPGQIEFHCRRDPFRPRILVLNYPSNPTGGTYEPAELEAIARVAARFRLVVLSDEIYGELHHEGRHVSISRFYPEGTILSSGLSKWCGAGGWRLGTFACPPTLDWLLDAMASVASETYTSTSAPIQFAAVRAFQGGIRIERYLWLARRILGALTRTLHSKLAAVGAAVLPPSGAFYLFPDFGPVRDRLASRGVRTSTDLCNRLLDDTGVAVLPGSDFGRAESELSVRIATVDFDGTRALAAAEALRKDAPIDDTFLGTYAATTLEAVDRLCEWVVAK